MGRQNRGGKGRGSRGRGRSGRGSQQNNSTKGSVPNSAEALTVSVVGNEAFMDAVKETPCPVKVISNEENTIVLSIEAWRNLGSLISWFVTGIAADPSATLSFSPLLNKSQRAKVHAAIESYDALGTVSKGVADARYVAIVSKEGMFRRQLTKIEERQLRYVRQQAHERGIELSQDEASEIIQTSNVPSSLKDIVEKELPLQLTLYEINDAVENNNASAVEALVMANPRVLSEGLVDSSTGDGPLHIAAREGFVEVINVLLSHGAKIEIRNSYTDETPLAVARKAEHCEVEGLLLRAGATDSERNYGLPNAPLSVHEKQHQPPPPHRPHRMEITPAGDDTIRDDIDVWLDEWADWMRKHSTELWTCAAAVSALGFVMLLRRGKSM